MYDFLILDLSLLLLEKNVMVVMKKNLCTMEGVQ